MQQNTGSLERDEAAYARAVAGQLKQFPTADGMHDLPPIFWYWVEQHLKKKAEGKICDVFPDKFFANEIIECVNRTKIYKIISVGAGDATQEILIARELHRLGWNNIEIICADITPSLIENARLKIEEAGLSHQLHPLLVDLNLGFPTDQVSAVITIDALHHILNLEGLFEAVDKAIAPDGSFIFRDVIGRNGHMRWPEVLEPLRDMWSQLPDRLKIHALKQSVDPWFENFDCSVEGFEGIRAQDIMSLLEKRFDFDKLLTYGGLVDVFIDRIFGFNFDPNDARDRDFIDSLQAAEDRLTADGAISPTQIYAVARPRGRGIPSLSAAAARAVRQPEADHPPLDLKGAGLVVPYPPDSAAPLPVMLRPGAPLSFASGGDGVRALRWGWLAAEATHVWSYREDSGLVLHVGHGVSLSGLALHTLGYVAPGMGPQITEVWANGVRLGQIEHLASYVSVVTTLPLTGLRGRIELRFETNQSRRPDRDGGEDARAIGFALVSVEALA